jgi:hypothetical protein
MKAKLFDFICGLILQFICLSLLLLGFPNWLGLLSIFGGMWWAIGLWRGCYNWIKKRVVSHDVKAIGEKSNV